MKITELLFCEKKELGDIAQFFTLRSGESKSFNSSERAKRAKQNRNETLPFISVGC